MNSVTRSTIWPSRFCGKNHEYKLGLIRQPWQLPIISINLACIEIQKIVRGFLVRETNWNKEANEIIGIRPQITYENSEKNKIKKKSFAFSYYHIAATEIQRVWKEHLQNKCLLQIQETRTTPYVAASYIQRAWHRYKDKRLFRYYLELLRFRNQGDPAVLLKSINPREVPYFEKGTRIHVRFRFGGSHFPPNIYYKVFTRGAMCDVNSFAPRNYTHVKPRSAKSLHNHCSHKSAVCRDCVHLAADEVKSLGSASCSSCLSSGTIRVGNSHFETKLTDEAVQEYLNGADGWYEREENNGWRIVTATTLEAAAEDPVTKATNELKIKYHYSKIKRKRNIALQRKIKKREWMQKLYRQGVPGSAVGGTRSSLGESKWSDSNGFMESKEKSEFSDEDNDNEVEDLLLWTKGLDYDEYLRDWSTIGTSDLKK